MPLRINEDQNRQGGLRRLNQVYDSLAQTMEHLSSDLRVVRASDDPAGMVISEQLRSRIASLNREIESTSLAIRKYDTADASMHQLSSVLAGIQTMAAAAADDGIDDPTARQAYQFAVNRAVAHFNNIIETAGFGDVGLFGGGEGSLTELSPLAPLDLSTSTGARYAMKVVDRAAAELRQAQVEIGAAQKYDLETRRSSLEVTAQNLTAVEAEFRDTDLALEMAKLIRETIQVRASVAVMAHANVTQRGVLSLLGD
jgi:flagellin